MFSDLTKILWAKPKYIPTKLEVISLVGMINICRKKTKQIINLSNDKPGIYPDFWFTSNSS